MKDGEENFEIKKALRKVDQKENWKQLEGLPE
jgi:hypothetical protein